MIIKDHLHTVMCRLGFPSREDHMQQKADHQNERTAHWFALNRDEFGACYEAIVREERSGRMSPQRKKRLIALLQLFVGESQSAER